MRGDLQKRLFKIVKGSIKNTADAHPEWKITKNITHSIAKRIVGTLSSEMDGSLAPYLRGEPDSSGS